MASEQQKKQIQQVIILVALFGVLAVMFSVFAWPAIQQSSGKRPPKPAVTKQAQQQDGSTQQAAAPKTTATDMPKVGGVTGTGVEAAPGVENISGVPTGLNPNLFQVFDLSVSRNPFVQNEDWYSEQLNELLPGYPELRDDGYFESMEPYLPDISAVFGDRDWRDVQVQRSQKNTYNLSGSSEDGTIATSITLSEDIPTNTSMSWTNASSVPFGALSDPDFVANALNSGLETMGGPGVAPPDDGDLFHKPDGTLPNMDDYLAANGGSADQLGPNGAVLGRGDQLTCRGVNISQGSASALLDFNGQPYLVQPGEVIPTHYQIMDIKSDGVMIMELRDGSTTWLPLTLLIEPAAGASPAKTR